ncbi:FAD/FMN-containing dehydrogenase [Paenibacillus sp. URB8-2]|uniref:FAD/FMN-containing dehydrogenase n=1 Tax=Paenibacillus sp. URB8-2 TaxID=2741301 RepID=UPI0015BF7AFA|nr:FAD/FMN-containing dehydrogenase [Paenibacillus sp. URB8-2]BCG60444.1 hypothetical protein PUR_38690 [Paenibacillus sp. URB8-2]
MKKTWIVLAAVTMVFALGTAVYAATDKDKGFQEMLPQMKQMHPDVSEQQLQEMYNNCKSNGKGMSGMMNGEAGGMMGNMMNGSMQNMMNSSTTASQ